MCYSVIGVLLDFAVFFVLCCSKFFSGQSIDFRVKSCVYKVFGLVGFVMTRSEDKMLGYHEDLKIDGIVPGLKEQTRQGILEFCADHTVQHVGSSAEHILDGLSENHRLERACVGDGLAIFDLKVRGLREPYVMLVTLENDVDFGALDGLPIRLVCCVFSPQRDGVKHLRRLSRVSRLLKSEELREKIVGIHSESTIRSLLHNPDGWTIAA